jgi:low affinity Fe/Cu permease
MKKHRIGVFERFAAAIARAAGTTTAFTGALAVILIWAVAGPVFRYSDTWQLSINTGTTIVTFLMVFLIQRSQNKDSLALQLKLNELIASIHGASNRLVNAEDLSEHELTVLHRHYATLAKLAEEERTITKSHSVDEAENRHRAKRASPDGKKSPKTAPGT